MHLYKNIFTTQKIFNTLNKVCMVLHTVLLKPGVTNGVTQWGYQWCYRVVLQTEVSLWAIHIGIFCINTFYYCIYKCILLKNIFTTQKIFNTLNKVCMVLHSGVTRVVPGLLPRWS